MALFHINKKTETKPCSCGGDCRPASDAKESAVKVLGGGCKNCHKLLDNTKEALQSLGMDDTVELVTDPAVIASCGVMSTPALVVDGKVVSAGRVLTAEQAAEAIKAARSAKG